MCLLEENMIATMKNGFYCEDELKQMGFSNIGSNVKISRRASIYNASKMIIGNNVRIDDFCVLSGRVELGDYIHVAVYSAIFAGDVGVKINDFSGLSSRCVIYAESDDYSGEYLTNPTVDEEFLGVISERVELGKHVIIGSGTTILPGVSIGDGTAVGSMSLVNKSLDSWGIYAGIPCKYIKKRSNKLLELEKEFLRKED